MKLLLLTVVIDVEFFTKMTPSLRKEQRKKNALFLNERKLRLKEFMREWLKVPSIPD